MSNYKILKEFERKSVFTGKNVKYVMIKIPNEPVKVKNVLLKVDHIYCALDPRVYGPIKSYWEPINDSNFNVRRNFNEYRKKQKLMKPGLVKFLRKKIYDLNLRELSTVLGLGYATISKIEDNKIVQSVSQDSALRILLNPNEMVRLINVRLPIAKESSLVNENDIKRKANTNVRDIVLRCINLIAEDTRRKVLGNNSSDLSNPVDINKRIKDAMHAKIIRTNTKKADGAIKYNQRTKNPEIVLAKGESPLRQRFTIAHELGHFVIHENCALNNKDDLSDQTFSAMYRGLPGTSGSYREKQADEFAGAFLMPRAGIEKIYRNSDNKDPDYLKIDVSKRYKVSEDAAYRRIKNLRDRHVL